MSRAPANRRRGPGRSAWAAATLLLAGAAAPAQPSPGADLERLVEGCYDERLALDPVLATFNGDHRFDDRLEITISPAHRQRRRELEARCLRQAESIAADALDEGDRLTLEIFLYQGRLALEGLDHPDHLLPVDPFMSGPIVLALLGSGDSLQPFDSLEDHRRWLQRVAFWPAWVEQAIGNMKLGMEQGIVHPRAVMQRTLPQMEAQLVDSPEASLYWQPLARRAPPATAEQLQALQRDYRRAIMDDIVPGYRRLRDFIRDQYLPACRESAGLSHLPGGSAWYAFAIRAQTGTAMSAAEIHRLGLAEVERLQGEIAALGGAAGLSSSRRGFESPDALLAAYRSLEQRVRARLPRLFSQRPASPFEVRAVEPYRQDAFAGAAYMPGSPDGRPPGVFYVNTRGWRGASRAGTEALFLHEAIPGHHFQISVQRERLDLPRFRRFGHHAAFVEGWALYAESLGRELGLYQQQDARLAALQSELFRARRLVVDTGLHALGWSRQRAIDELGGAAAEVDRYIVLPAQALAYKIGQLAFSEQRRRAEARLGSRFDVRALHAALLDEGGMPLDILRPRMAHWLDRQAGATPASGSAP